MILSDLPNGNTLSNLGAASLEAIGMLSFRIPWKFIQANAPAGGITNDPTNASFVWNFFDDAIALAAQVGKPAFFRTTVQGSQTPTWVKANAAQYVDAAGTAIDLWWDTYYQAAVIALIQATGTKYSGNPWLKVIDYNIAANNTGDWTVPHAASQGNTETPPNWEMVSNVPCPAYGATVVVTPQPGSVVYPGWYVLRNSFGWFYVQSITGTPTNPTSATLLNPGTPGNVNGIGTIGSNGIFQVSDVGTLTGPVYNYTTNRFVTAVNEIMDAMAGAFPTQLMNHEVGRNGTLDPYPNSGTTYEYNAATAFAQRNYGAYPGRFAIGKNTIQAMATSPAESLAQQDKSQFYLPAQCLPGSNNTSGTTGTIPANSLLDFQFNWPCFDSTGTYSSATTASANGPYAANGHVPYVNPIPVYQETIALCEEYGGHITEVYEIDALHVIPVAGSYSGNTSALSILANFSAQQLLGGAALSTPGGP